LTGLQPGEIIRAIDFRPATGQLYGIGDTGRLYTINSTTAVATSVGAPFALADGTSVSMDFNPTVDRIRVISSADENFRLNPDTGAVAGTDTNLAYDAGDPNNGANPDVLAVGYTNNVAGATTTTLYGIDFSLNTLIRQGGVDGGAPSPNTGTLFTVGPIGVVPAFDRIGLDVGADGTAFAYLEAAGGVPQLHTINLATSAATLVGNIGSAEVIIDIAAQVVPATPSPAPSATPTTAPTAAPTTAGTPTPVQPGALPPTGGRGNESGPTAVALIAAAAVILTAGTLAYRRRRAG
jgi:hypothetical protein